MKRLLLWYLAVMVAFLLIAYFLWWRDYVARMDWATAYSDYVSSDCQVCLDYFQEFREDKIGLLELELELDGVVMALSSAHHSSGYAQLTDREISENERVQKLILLFLDKGADINYVNDAKPSYSALYAAVVSADSSLVSFLLEQGADAAIPDTIPGVSLLPVERAVRDLNKVSEDGRLRDSLTEIVDELFRRMAEKGDGG